MKKLISIVLLLSTLLCTLADDRTGPIYIAPNTPKPEDEERPYLLLVGQAEKAAAEGQWQEAADRLVDAMSVEPGNPTNVLLLSNLGMMYSALDRDTLALQAYDRALEIAPSMTAIYNRRARQYLKMRRDQDALADFSHVIQLDSLNAEARYYHGLMTLYAANLDEAEKDLEVLRTKYPKALETAVALSTLYTMTGRDDKAVPYLQRLCEDDPAAEYYAQLAGCYLKQSNLSEAAATLADGMKRFPDDPELFYYRAWLNRERMRLDDAHADAARAVQLGASPKRVNALFEKKDPKSRKK